MQQSSPINPVNQRRARQEREAQPQQAASSNSPSAIEATIPPAATDYKSTLLPLMIQSNALKFGTFTLKSGRISPYFFTSTVLHTTELLQAQAASYASVLSDAPFCETTPGPNKIRGVTPKYDVLFGPAYKGIPLAASVATELAHTPNAAAFKHVSYAFNRKEAKDHGEGGTIVGSSLKDKRVLILDDVITAGTALREAVSIIKAQGGTVAGVVVLLNRQERVSDAEPRSALKVAEDDLKVPVRAVVQFEDFIEATEAGQIEGAGEKQLEAMKAYRAKYGEQK